LFLQEQLKDIIIIIGAGSVNGVTGQEGRSTRALSAPPRAQTGMTADQRRLLAKLEVLQDSRDWRGVVAMERNAKVVAAAVREAEPGEASFVYSALGNAHESLALPKRLDRIVTR
jgi:hypothetical protein